MSKELQVFAKLESECSAVNGPGNSSKMKFYSRWCKVETGAIRCLWLEFWATHKYNFHNFSQPAKTSSEYLEYTSQNFLYRHLQRFQKTFQTTNRRFRCICICICTGQSLLIGHCHQSLSHVWTTDLSWSFSSSDLSWSFSWPGNQVITEHQLRKSWRWEEYMTFIIHRRSATLPRRDFCCKFAEC